MILSVRLQEACHIQDNATGRLKVDVPRQRYRFAACVYPHWHSVSYTIDLACFEVETAATPRQSQLPRRVRADCLLLCGYPLSSIFFGALHFNLRTPSNVVTSNFLAEMLSVREWAIT